MFIGIFGFLAASVGVIWFIASIFTKQSFKKPLVTIAAGFVMFIVGVSIDVNNDEPAEKTSAESSQSVKDSNEEDSASVAESKKKEEDKKAEAEAILAEEKAKAESESTLAEEEAKAESESIAAEEEAAAKAEAELNDPSTYKSDVTYEQIARTPDDYLLEKVKFSGKVVQVMEGEDTINQLRVAINDDYDNIMLVEYEKDILDSRVLEDDYINIYGFSAGVITYESTMGGNITIPAISANMIEY